MSIRTAAAREEEAELKYLRAQADGAGAEVAQTLAELVRRISVTRRPGAAARRLTAGARVTALRSVREGPGKIAGQRGAKRLALAAIPVLVAVALAAAARGKLPPAKTS
jgi:hypothetical protein